MSKLPEPNPLPDCPTCGQPVEQWSWTSWPPDEGTSTLWPCGHRDETGLGEALFSVPLVSSPEAFAVRMDGEWWICAQVGPSESYPEVTYQVLPPSLQSGDTWLGEWVEAVIPLRYEEES